jgi:phosphonoacetaldehyde hydrolase
MPRQCKRFSSSTQAVLFDIEGVLMDPDSAATAAAIVDVFGRREVEVTPEEALSQPSATECSDNHQLRNELRAVMNAVAAKWKAAKGAAPTEWDLEAMWKELPQAVSDQMIKAPAADGATDTVAALVAQGVKIGATLEFDEEATPAWVRHAEASGIHIDASLSACQAGVGNTKGAPPAPWRSIALAANLEVYPNNSCIRVTNKCYGVEEGCNAGMWTIGVTSGDASGFYDSGAHYVISSVAGFMDVYNEIQLRMRMGDKP